MLGPAGAALWSAPTVDAAHHTVYITTGDNYSDPPTATSDAVLAFDTETGKLLWLKQVTESDIYNNMACGRPGVGSCPQGSGPDFDFGAPPILVNLPSGKLALLLGQKSGMVYAVDPDAKGKLLRQARAGKGTPLGGIEWGMASNENLVFAAVSDIGFAHSPVPGKIESRPQSGRRSIGVFGRFRQTRLESASCVGMRRPQQLQPGAIGRRHRYRWSGLFRGARWTHPGLFHQGRRGDLGL